MHVHVARALLLDIDGGVARRRLESGSCDVDVFEDPINRRLEVVLLERGRTAETRKDMCKANGSSHEYGGWLVRSTNAQVRSVGTIFFHCYNFTPPARVT